MSDIRLTLEIYLQSAGMFSEALRYAGTEKETASNVNTT